MLLAFSVSPTTTDAPDGSVSEAVARAVRVVRDSGYETAKSFSHCSTGRGRSPRSSWALPSSAMVLPS